MIYEIEVNISFNFHHKLDFIVSNKENYDDVGVCVINICSWFLCWRQRRLIREVVSTETSAYFKEVNLRNMSKIDLIGFLGDYSRDYSHTHNFGLFRRFIAQPFLYILRTILTHKKSNQLQYILTQTCVKWDINLFSLHGIFQFISSKRHSICVTFLCRNYASRLDGTFVQVFYNIHCANRMQNSFWMANKHVWALSGICVENVGKRSEIKENLT